jgi:CRISPR-associated protein Csy1
MHSDAGAAARELLERVRTLHRNGDAAQALAAFDTLPSLEGETAESWYLAGTLAHDLGLRGEAQRLLTRAIELAPRAPPAHAALGQLHLDEERFAEALASFQSAAALNPTPRAWNNVGVALMALGRRDEARAAFEQALRLDPRYALASFNLARVFLTHDLQAAQAHAQAAAQADPTSADTWLLLGDIFRRRHDSQNALRAINLAIERAPQRPAGWTARAGVRAEAGEGDAAREEYAAAWQRFPSDLRAALGANLTLPQVYAGREHLESSRAGYAKGLDTLHDAADAFRFSDPETALVQARWTNFYLAYQGRNDRDLQARYGAFQRRVFERAAPDLVAPREPRGRAGRIRVGFLSHYFYNCVAGRYFASWITRLDAERFDKYVYYTNGWMADDTRAIAAASRQFRHVAGLPLASVARQVIADELDVLVFPEVGMHPDTVTFAALRLAPVQCMAWGHPTTSGSAEIDWYLSCAGMEPADAAAHYSERLELLPGLGTHYRMPVLEGSASRGELGLPADGTLYLAPQSLFKMHPDNDALIARVLAEDPHGVVVMFEANQAESTRVFRARLDAALARADVPPERVHMLKPDLPHAAYLRLNNACDAMLDSLHWSGGNTSIDAIAAGLPIVTLPGALMRGRQSAAMLHALQLDECIATSRDDYVAKALAIAHDEQRREQIAQRLRTSRDVLFGRDEPIRALEDFLERAARAG